MGPQELFATQHKQWFASVFKGHVRRASRIDPYHSSARDATSFYRKLLQVEQGAAVPSQVVTDTRAAGLMERVDGEVELTQFGRRVLRDWRRLGITTPDEKYELALATGLLRAGLDESIPLFHNLYRRWQRLVALQPAGYWLESKWRLTLPEYLDQEQLGFNPFSVIAATNAGIVGDEPEWRAWAASDSSLSVPINMLISKVDKRRGRKEFCQAMELIRLSEHYPGALTTTLESWN